MAGRYDSNPFDEDEVNPFSVSNANSISAYRGFLLACGVFICTPFLYRMGVRNNQFVADLSSESNAGNYDVL